MAKEDAFTSSKTAHPVIALECASTQHPSPRSVDWYSGAEAWPPRSQDLTYLDFSYEDSLTVTIPAKTRCVLLHYDSFKTLYMSYE
jgi:hypothetical protein